MVRLLIEKEKVDINSTNKYGYTALHIAAEYGRVEIIEYLIRNGVNVNAEASIEFPITPLFCSIPPGHVDTFKLLVQHGARTDIVLENTNLLESAIISNNPDIIELLLDNGFTVDQNTPSGLLPISFALSLNKNEAVALSLEKGADYRKLCVNEHNFPLHHSTQVSHHDSESNSTKLLLEYVKRG